jgi:hypothetical protein
MYELYGYEKKIYSPEKAHESGYRPLEKGSSHHAVVAIFFFDHGNSHENLVAKASPIKK